MTQIPMAGRVLRGGSGSLGNYSTAPIMRTFTIAQFDRVVTVTINQQSQYIAYLSVGCAPTGGGGNSIPAGATLALDVSALRDIATLGTPAMDYSQSYTSTYAVPGDGTLGSVHDYAAIFPTRPASSLSSIAVRMTNSAGDGFNTGHVPVGPSSLRYALGNGSKTALRDASGELVTPGLRSLTGDTWDLVNKAFAGSGYSVTLSVGGF